jgi:hypothetical protein
MTYLMEEKTDQQIVQDAGMLATVLTGLAIRRLNPIFPVSNHNQQRVSLPLWQCSLRI